MGSLPRPHLVIFPFMSQGHIIPLLHLSRILRRRSAAVTLFTTAGNSKPIRSYLQDNHLDVSVVELPFPQNIKGVPQGVENTHQLPSMASFVSFASSTKLMQKSFEQALETIHPPVSCIVSDAFLGWTLQSAQKISVPRLVFFGMSHFSCTMYQILLRERPHAGIDSLNEPFLIPGFPKLLLTRNHFEAPFNDLEPSGPYVDFMVEQITAMAMSQGMVVNSFYELEGCYVDYWNEKIGPKAFCVGPLCTAAQPPETKEKPSYIEWLDEKQSQGKDVLYVSFGTQAEVGEEQLEEIAKGLENSGVYYLWALKSDGNENLMKFENRGLVFKGWVDQLGILRHEAVKGFMSHCGWNSVMESMSAGIPILALPFMAEQHLNARFMVEEIEVGLRIMPRDEGTVRGVAAAEEVERKVRELMDGGGKAVDVRRKMGEYGGAARAAMEEGGSSWCTLGLLIDDVCGIKPPLIAK